MNGANVVRIAIFTIDRTFLRLRADLAETVANHLDNGELVQVEDSSKPSSDRLRYTIQWIGKAGHVFDGSGRQLGVFADLDALVDRAETVTA